jgi:hypothetical protein
LIAPAPFAFLAIRILRLARLGKNLLNFAFVLSVHFSYAYQATGLACVVVNSFPEAERRRVGRISSGTDDDENHQKRGVKRFHRTANPVSICFVLLSLRVFAAYTNFRRMLII